MTDEEIKAAFLIDQASGSIETDLFMVDRYQDRTLFVSFFCHAYSTKSFGQIAQHYTVELRSVQGMTHQRLLVGLMLTPKAATV